MSPKEDAHNCDDAVFAEVIRDDEFITMHAITKNVQSIRDDNRWLDFVLELEGQVFDILFLTETWRSDVEEAFISPLGDYIYLSGGSHNATNKLSKLNVIFLFKCFLYKGRCCAAKQAVEETIASK